MWLLLGGKKNLDAIEAITRIGFTSENPEGSAEECHETKPKFCPPDGFDRLGLAAPGDCRMSRTAFASPYFM